MWTHTAVMVALTGCLPVSRLPAGPLLPKKPCDVTAAAPARTNCQHLGMVPSNLLGCCQLSSRVAVPCNDQW